MVAPPRQHQGPTEPDDDNDDDGGSSNDKPKPQRRWWQLWGPRSQPHTTPNKGQQPFSPAPSAAGGAAPLQQQHHPRQRRRARRPSMDEVSKSVAAGASSYRTRQFPEVSHIG